MIEKWQYALTQRSRIVIRDWQVANRVRLTGVAAEDLSTRIVSALMDAVSVGAQATHPEPEEPVIEGPVIES